MSRISFKSAPIYFLVGLAGLHQGAYAAAANEHDSVLGQGIQSNVAIVEDNSRRTLLDATSDDYGTGAPEDYSPPQEEGVFITGDPAAGGTDMGAPGDDNSPADPPGTLPALGAEPMDDYASTTGALGPTTTTTAATPPTAPPPDIIPEIAPPIPELAVDPMDAPMDAVDGPADGPDAFEPYDGFVDYPTGGPDPVPEPLAPTGTELPGTLAPEPEDVGTTDSGIGDGLDGGEVPPGEVESGVPGVRAAGVAAAVAAAMAVPLLL